VQFGVFSPLLRLHSSASPFNSKEPWRFNKIAGEAMKDSLRLRHCLLPYLYTMNRYASREGSPLVQPMYYHHAEQREAYGVPNQYYFGTELIACPITQPVHSKTGVAEFKAWLPEGLWTDFFSGRVYDGGRRLSLYRTLEQIPVLAKAGAIVPMADLSGHTSAVDNPQQLEVRVFAGADGQFQLWEDAGDTAEDLDGNWCVTGMAMAWGQAGQSTVFTIQPAQGNTAVVPERRSWKLVFMGCAEAGVTVTAGGTQIAAEAGYDEASHALTVIVPELGVTESLEVTWTGARVAVNRVEEEIFHLLDTAQIRFELKEQIYRLVKETASPAAVLASLASLELEAPLYGALCEIVTARL
jgi:hypothetical protein